MLGQVKAFMAEKKVANLVEVARHLEAQPSAVQPMLEHLIRKNIIMKSAKPTGCGSTCVKCDPAIAQVYQHID